MWLILAKASPLKPYVPIVVKSSKVLSFEVVNRSQSTAMSSRCQSQQIVSWLLFPLLSKSMVSNLH